jgi:hypothetical protein
VQAVGAFCFPRGRRIESVSDVWTRPRYFVELEAGPELPPYLARLLEPARSR